MYFIHNQTESLHPSDILIEGGPAISDILCSCMNMSLIDDNGYNLRRLLWQSDDHDYTVRLCTDHQSRLCFANYNYNGVITYPFVTLCEYAALDYMVDNNNYTSRDILTSAISYFINNPCDLTPILTEVYLKKEADIRRGIQNKQIANHFFYNLRMGSL